MQSYQGKSVYKGIAMGPVVVLKKNDYQVKRTRIEDPEAEIKRVDEALEKSKEQLQKLYDKAVQEVGEASAAIFEVHQMMLEDDDYLEAIQNTIRTEQINAEYAVAATGDNFAEMFASMDDDYMKARSADIKDISERLVRNLSGQDDADLSSIEPSIIVADDLSPSETVQMDKDKILAFVTVHGSTNSHTAILARMMNIPALIGVDMNLEELQMLFIEIISKFQMIQMENMPVKKESYPLYEQAGNEVRRAETVDELFGILEHVILESFSDDASPGSKNDRIVRQVIQLIQDNVNTNITLNQIAQEIYISPNYLGCIFKEEIGMSFNEYLQQYRMKLAQKLLKSHKFKVYEISAMVGYKNPSYFTKLFTEYTGGICPSDYEK